VEGSVARSVPEQAQRLALVSAVVSATVVATLIAGSGVAFAGPATPPSVPAAPTPPTPPSPTPPPGAPSNPTDQQLGQSKQDIASKGVEVGRLSSQLTQVQEQADRLGMKLSARQEDANQALADQLDARAAADSAARKVAATRSDTVAASAAIEQAHQRLDQFITAAYLQGVDAGSLGLLIEATNPDDLVRRAELTEALAVDQKAALDSLQRARVAKVNADSLARAAEEQARAAEATAVAAKRTADGQVASAEIAVRAGQAELAKVESVRVSLEQQLDALTAKDAGLRAQRQRYLDFQAQQAAKAAAEAKAAAARVAAASQASARGSVRATGTISQVIDRALSQIGKPYAWGGGNDDGPTKGSHDGGRGGDQNGDFRKIGFDCSGLMIYAFGAANVPLPHYSGYQYNQGRKVPISQIQAGDMLFWADNGRIHHVALYIGNGQMVEAPYSGARIRITPVRYGDGLMPYATRVL
jgi:cell wall-associated NlpC family hydrolase